MDDQKWGYKQRYESGSLTTRFGVKLDFDREISRTPRLTAICDHGEIITSMAYKNLYQFPRDTGAGIMRETIDDKPFLETARKLLKSLSRVKSSVSGIEVFLSVIFTLLRYSVNIEFLPYKY